MKKIFTPTILLSFLFFCNAIKADLNDGLVAYYPFSGNANDSSNNGLNGTVTGAALAQDRFGNIDNAYAFDGIDDKIVIQNTNNAFDLTISWTLSVWVKPFNPGIDAREDPILWKSANDALNYDTFKLGWGTGDSPDVNKYLVGLENASNDDDLMVFSSTHSPNQWQHIVGIYDGNSILIYVNGMIENTLDIGNITAYVGSEPLRIGNIQGTSHVGGTYDGAFYGIIDDVRIYDRALSGPEVFQLYQIPEPTTLSFLILGGMGLLRKYRRK